MIEAEVHQQLRAFLRSQAEPYWPHHLTMGRLVARALRLGRSALIQTGGPTVGCYSRHRLSYLMPVLMWPDPVILVAPEPVQQRLQLVEIPQLQQWIQTHKTIRTGDRWPCEDFRGLLIVSPESWLSDRLYEHGWFPSGVTTIVDCADDLENWARNQLSASIQPTDWNQLMLARPDQAETIRNARVQLTRAIFQHPENPYECCLLDLVEQEIFWRLYRTLQPVPQTGQNQGWENGRSSALPEAWMNFWQHFHPHSSDVECQDTQENQPLLWATIDRIHGQFTVSAGPVEVALHLTKVWPKQPVVLVGGALDLDTQASIYRQQLGLGELTCVKFSNDPHNELIQLYLPERLPMPNTPQFQDALLQELRMLLCISATGLGLTVILVGDMPLKARLGSVLAAEFGSRVQVERTGLDETGILVTGWEFWCQYQTILPAPKLLAIATLPIPSLENPLVAGRVGYYKQRRQDWFRLYLLPAALSTLQRALSSVRQRQGIVALLDSRVLHRTYGQQVLVALSPYARIDYLDVTWFNK